MVGTLSVIDSWKLSHSGAKLSPTERAASKIVDGLDSMHPIWLEFCVDAYISAERLHHWTVKMLIILYILTALGFACVVLTLIMGTVAMSKKSEENRKKSNDWMWRRIYAQVATVLLLVLTVYVKSKSG